MGKPQSVDAFVCNGPEVAVDAEASRILEERMNTAEEGRLVSAEEAWRRLKQWLSNSGTTETRQTIWMPFSTGRGRSIRKQASSLPVVFSSTSIC
jgi:hypothetical protein